MKLNKLERLLRGDEATYDGNKVVETRDFRKIDKGARSICIFFVDSDNGDVLSGWIPNDLSVAIWNDVKFTEPSKARTIEEGLRVNDIIVDVEGDEKKVLGVLNTIVFVSSNTNHDLFTYADTLKELIIGGFKLKQPEPIANIEISKQEIAKVKNIDVKLIGEVTIK